VAQHAAAAAGRRHHAEEHLDRAALAGAVLSEEAGDGAALDVERQIAHRLERAVGLAETSRLDHGGMHHLLRLVG
jgi:hypothetical protein